VTVIQIYTFTDVEQAQEAAALGVDNIGFVAGKYGVVHGELTFVEARRLADSLHARATRVALTMATDVDEIVRMAEAVGPDVVHVSTDPDDVGPAAMTELRRRLPESTKLMKAIPVSDESAVAAAQHYAEMSDYLLLDTKVRGLPGVGASGRTHDWHISRRIVESVSIPVILAGGLTPENVRQSMQAARAWGVDSNTGTNIAGGSAAKDMERIRAFVAAVRAQDQADAGS